MLGQLVINGFLQVKGTIFGARSYEIEVDGEDIRPVVFLYLSRLDGYVIPLPIFHMRKYQLQAISIHLGYTDLDPLELRDYMPPPDCGCMRNVT